MADIFISYANEDRDRAARLAALLESSGWNVWWDRRIPAGRSWRNVLEDALVDTRCMMVLWSQHSVTSPWVAEEAEEARRLKKTLLPVLIDPVEPPIGFRTIQAADLSGWEGSADDPAARQLIADLKSLLDPGREIRQPPAEEISKQSDRRQIFDRLKLHWRKAVLGALAVSAGIFVLQYDWSGPEPSPAPELRSHDSVSSPRLTGLAVSGQRNRIKPSETVKLTLKGQYSDGSQSDLASGVEWQSSDSAVAVVDEQGEVTGLKAGTVTIVAKVGGVESDQWKLGVEAPEPVVKPTPPAPKLVELQIRSSKQELLASEKASLRAKAIYSDKSEKYLSSGIVWRVSDRTIAALNDRGELIARRPGKVEIVASADNISSAGLTVVVKEMPKPPEVKPAPAKAPELPVKPALQPEQTKLRIAAYVGRAQNYREQGNYAAALAELEKARALDPASIEVRREIDQTKRACNAEKILGNPIQCQ